MDKEQFGAMLRVARLDAGIEAAEVAILTGTSRTQMTNLELGYHYTSLKIVCPYLRTIGRKMVFTNDSDEFRFEVEYGAEFGAAMQQIRLHYCLSQEQFAKEIGVTKQTVRNVEEIQHHCSIRYAFSVVNVFDITLTIE